MTWFWVYGAVGLGLVAFACLFVGRVRAHLASGQRLPLSDYVAVTGAVLNIVVLVIAIISVHVAITTYEDAARSGAEQTRVLRASRDALAGVIQSLDKQEETLEKSRHVLDSSVTTAVAQQNLLFQSVANSRKQLAILQAQWARELEQPDVHLALLYTDDLSAQVMNRGKKVARDTLYQGIFWKLNKPRPAAFEWANAKPTEVKYIRPGGGFAPTELQWNFGNGATSLLSGDRLFGYMTVQCPDCLQERLYWIYFEVSGEGFYREGHWDEYSFAAEDAANSAEKLLSSKGLIRLTKGSLIR